MQNSGALFSNTAIEAKHFQIDRSQLDY